MGVLIARNWWALLVRGIVGIVFGILAISWPGITFAVLLALFGVYALVDGVMNIVGAVRRSRANERWGATLLEGIVGIAAGVFVFVWPALTGVAIVFVIAAWALVTGIAEISAAIRLRKYISGEWLMALSGVISVLLGVFLFARPLIGAIAIAMAVGIYAIAFGVMEVALSFRLRSWARSFPEPEALRPAA